MKKRKPDLHVVKPAPQPQPRADLYDHEWKERQRIMGKDWSKVHVRGDRAAPVEILERPSWWKGWVR